MSIEELIFGIVVSTITYSIGYTLYINKFSIEEVLVTVMIINRILWVLADAFEKQAQLRKKKGKAKKP
ncbi:MAG: hypothetical protein AAB508_06540 [Patescibacteria group bacterium]